MAAPDRRSVPRAPADFSVQVCGIDADGKRFEQAAAAKNISLRGALLVGLQGAFRSGDLVKIQLGDKSAAFRVVWVSPGKRTGGIKVAVQRIEADPCIGADQIVQETELPARHN